MIHDENIIKLFASPILFNGEQYNNFYYEKRIVDKHYKYYPINTIEDYFKQVLETINGKVSNYINIEKGFQIYQTASITSDKPAQSNFRDSYFGIDNLNKVIIFTHLSSISENQYINKIINDKYIK